MGRDTVTVRIGRDPSGANNLESPKTFDLDPGRSRVPAR